MAAFLQIETPPVWLRYSVALLLSVVALLATAAISYAIGGFVFALFYVAVMVSAWYGGLGPGLLTTALVIASSDYFFLPPAFTLELGPTSLVRLAVVAMIAVTISSLTKMRVHAEQRLRESNMALAERSREAQQAAAELRRQVERMARLQRVTAALSQAATPEHVAEAVVEAGLAAVGADAGAIFALADEGRRFQALNFRGYPIESVEARVLQPAERSGPLWEAVRTRAVVVAETPEEMLERWPNLAASQRESGDAATAAVPLLLNDRVLGVLYVAFRAPRAFAEDDRALLLSLGQQCAQALDRARLFEAEQRARKGAEEAVRMRDVFFSVAAHELKTPLTSLLGQAQLLQRRMRREAAPDPRYLHSVEVVVAQAGRLSNMVTALLDISRIEQGRLSIERIPLDLCALVRQVVDEIQPTLGQHTIVCDMPAEALSIEGDELRLEQVLQNLIGNAVKYSPSGGEVRVRVWRDSQRARVEVADHGLGIPAGALPHLFKRFFRAPNVDPRQISGMGIGLYVVKEIVGLHGGDVAVASEEGRGSTFSFWLPLAAGDEGQPQPFSSPAQAYSGVAP